MGSRIRTAYDQRLKDGRLTPDASQGPVVDALARLETDLGRRTLFGGVPEVRGLYLWGPPGRGKSLLMDMFCACAPEPKKRAHFHVFMARVHDLIRQWREGDAKTRRRVFGQHKGDDPIRPVAALIASEARLLCFDELQVTDIGDALILGRLFEALFAHKVVLVVTSNRAPDQLYLDGINRPLFVPFITMLERRCVVLALSGTRDWRLDRLMGTRVWYNGTDIGREIGFDHLWSQLKGEPDEAPTTLKVLGRDVVIARTAGGLARATFDELCGQPLGAQDYLAIAARFHTLFLEGVPILGPDRAQEARRFVTLIDALYEAGTRLVTFAAAAPDALYTQGTGAFEFQRTVSRLNEMSSADWLARART